MINQSHKLAYRLAGEAAVRRRSRRLDIVAAVKRRQRLDTLAFSSLLNEPFIESHSTQSLILKP